jgi:hypothetical protein
MRQITASLIVALLALPAAAAAGTADFRPDPASAQRFGAAYRYPQAGWIVLHIEGEPYERGYQHGHLLASEIAGYLRCFAALRSPKAPADGWKNTRSLVDALFLRRYEKEFLEEMKGIADGATAAGARFDGRPIDLVDIVGINSWPEIETLESALEATSTGLEGMKFPHPQPRAMPDPKQMHCSAFAATGPATADGKIVFGHITMFGLYPSLFYNVWLDVKPAKGHRVLMQTYPGGIQSGLDYYMNDAGLLVCETTIAQTKFNVQGMSLASRIRQVLQYADSIDRAAEILANSNNGLYTNEWLLGDIKTNEIAMFELGTAKTKLYRSSKNEWFGGTDGFYWGCNNTKDLDVRLETIASVDARPDNMVWVASPRDRMWQQLYAKHKGKIGAGFGKEAFTTAPLCAISSLDAKYTTTDMAKELKTWALFGPPLGRTWKPSDEAKQTYPEIRPMVSNPWTVLTVEGPPPAEPNRLAAVDLHDRVKEAHGDDHAEQATHTQPAWHGTILPKTDADAWLATAFASYERIVAKENAWKTEHPKTGLTPSERDQFAVSLFAYRSAHAEGARWGGDVPLAETHSRTTSADWYRVANGKGVLLLNELRQLLGADKFAEMMDNFGRENAGKEVTTGQFQAQAEKTAGKSLQSFFDGWLKQPGLPMFHLANVRCDPPAGAESQSKTYKVEGEISRNGLTAPASVEVTVETAKGEVTKRVSLDSERASFSITTKEAPVRVVVDKYGLTAKGNGGPFSIFTFYADLEHALIVYGTADEVPTNREAAEALQDAIRRRGWNITVPSKSDTEVTEEDLKTHHLLLVGRPDSNRVCARMREALPITFGSRSFMIGRDTYAHPLSAIIVAGENPLDHRYSIVVFAGLSAESTLSTASLPARYELREAEAAVLAHGEKMRQIVIPARELVHDFGTH